MRRFRVSSRQPKSAPLADHTIAIDVTDYAVFEALADLLSPFGSRCLWQPRHRPELADADPMLGIFDGGQLGPPEWDHLRCFASRLAQHDAPLLVLLDFPRHEHYAMAQEIGVAAIVAKPYHADLLITELTRLISCASASRFETAIS
jgi:hypothetical protein